jgi:hypothetical protein
LEKIVLKPYPVSDALATACRYAATIARFRYRGKVRGLIPETAEETATVTFVKIFGRVYAATAGHVIKILMRKAKEDGFEYEGFYCPQSPGVAILGPFLSPPEDYLGRQPDIALCPVDAHLPKRIGKAPFEVLPEGDAAWPVTHALAIGFPTSAKYDVEGQKGRVTLALPCVRAVAEGLNSSGESDQVMFNSELLERPNIVSLSGMSGGPVFWSDDERFGLIGFVKEALDVTSTPDVDTFYTEPKVNFVCQRVDFSIAAGWAKHVDSMWENERDKINAEIERRKV